MFSPSAKALNTILKKVNDWFGDIIIMVWLVNVINNI